MYSLYIEKSRKLNSCGLTSNPIGLKMNSHFASENSIAFPNCNTVKNTFIQEKELSFKLYEQEKYI